ncbi:MAG: DUF1822 family protein [Coleofasciculus sp. C2-GNP5-27]
MANTQMLNETSLPMPITRHAIQTAEQFAAAIPHPEKAQQVYLNTLAVQAVHDYLELMGIDTNLQQSDSWNPVVRMCEDVADLMVTGLGKLECRPVLSDMIPDLNAPIQSSAVPICPIPLEVQDERIGYVVVDIHQQTKKATLLGFTKTAGTGELFWHQLESVDALLDHLETLAQPQVRLSQWLENVFETDWQDVSRLETTTNPSASSQRRASRLNLGQWFEQIFDQGWQAIEQLLGADANLQPQFRGGLDSITPRGERGLQLLPEADVMRAKLLDLALQLETQTVALLVALSREMDGRISLFVQVYPAMGELYLPPHLKLILQSAQEDVLQEVESRGQDVCTQLRPFKVEPGTHFSLKLTLGDVSITESFFV